MADTSSLQDLTIPTGRAPHRELYQRRERRSRGGEHHINEPNMGLPKAASGLQAMLTTQSGGIVNHLGTSTSGPRLVIPLPAALATATAMAKGIIVPTPVAGAAGTPASPNSPLPSMAIDIEWFNVTAYPPEIQQYLAIGWSFGLKPTSAATIMETTQVFLRHAYTNLASIGLNIAISAGLTEIFNEVVQTNDDIYRTPKHPYGESEAVNNIYMIMAYVISTLLWTNGAHRPLREYAEVTYPGVIMASYVRSLLVYYVDISNNMGLLGPSAPRPYLRGGGHTTSSPTSVMLYHGDTSALADLSGKDFAFTMIPVIAHSLRIAAEYILGKKTLTGSCDKPTYAALQDAALNVRNLDATVAKSTILFEYPDKTNPVRQKIADTRCTYYLALIQKKIRPGDTAAAVAGGTPGIETLSDTP